MRPVLALCLGLCACASPARRADPAVLDEVWELAREHFHDPAMSGVDWPAARERARAALGTDRSPAAVGGAVNGMLAELGASHTAFLTRDDLAWSVLLDLFWEGLEPAERARVGGSGPPLLPGIGLLTEELEVGGARATFVRGVLEGSPAASADLRVGDRLLAVDGEPFRPVASFRDRVGRPTRVRVQRTAAPTSIEELRIVPEALVARAWFLRALRAGARIVERDGQRLAVAHLWSYAGEELHEALREILAGPLAAADGLVLDLRAGFGGANPEYLNLFRRDLPVLSARGRDGSEAVMPASWAKPVVLLVDEGTTSGKEIFAHGFRRLGLGPIVGARTAGAVLGGRVFVLDDGSVLWLAVQDVRVDGERLEGCGIEPDVPVAWSRPYSGGRDPQLERALDVLAASLP